MTMLELLEESPIIAAIKSWEGLEKSLKSECKVVFVLFGTICDIDQIVARIKDAGKVAIVHVDMIQGLSTKRVAVDFIAHNTRADGIISTKNTLVERAKEMGLYAIQRTFVVDSIALDTLKKQIEMFRPDAVEIMPVKNAEFIPSTRYQYDENDINYIEHHINQFRLNDIGFKTNALVEFLEDVINADGKYREKKKYSNYIVDLFMEKLKDFSQTDVLKLCENLYTQYFLEFRSE